MLFTFTFLTLVFSLIGLITFSAPIALYSMICAFCLTAPIYYLLGATYVAMMLFAVYVGAVAVLFIFCLMLLNIGSEPVRTFSTVGFFFLLLAGFCVPFLSSMSPVSFFFSEPFFSFSNLPSYDLLNYEDFSSGQVLSLSLYTDFIYVVVMLGFLLFSVTVFVTVLFSQILETRSKLLKP